MYVLFFALSIILCNPEVPMTLYQEVIFCIPSTRQLILKPICFCSIDKEEVIAMRDMTLPVSDNGTSAHV